MRDRKTASTSTAPTMTDDGRPFVDPPWAEPLDVAPTIAAIPADAQISGMFFIGLVAATKARDIALPSARDRYLQFGFYPVAEIAQLLAEAAEPLFPGRTFRHALRSLGRQCPGVFLSSTLGKVTLGSTDGVHAAIAAMTNAYELNLRPSRVSMYDSGATWAVVRLDKVVYFLDSNHVGTFEGILRFAGVKGSVRIASRSAVSADFLLTWKSAP